jgi:antitoxin Phd
MSTMTVTQARENFSEAIATSALEAVFIQKHGENAAVLISPKRYEELMDALEEIEDIIAVTAALEDPSPNIPWEEVKRQLGLK